MTQLTKATDTDPASDFGKLARHLTNAYVLIEASKGYVSGARQVELMDRMIERHRAACAVLGIKVTP
jgi:hypothetical protein